MSWFQGFRRTKARTWANECQRISKRCTGNILELFNSINNLIRSIITSRLGSAVQPRIHTAAFSIKSRLGARSRITVSHQWLTFLPRCTAKVQEKAGEQGKQEAEQKPRLRLTLACPPHPQPRLLPLVISRIASWKQFFFFCATRSVSLKSIADSHTHRHTRTTKQRKHTPWESDLWEESADSLNKPPSLSYWSPRCLCIFSFTPRRLPLWPLPCSSFFNSGMAAL